MILEIINTALAHPAAYFIIAIVVGLIIRVVCIFNRKALQEWDVEPLTLFLLITFLAIGWPVVILALIAGCIGGIVWGLSNLLIKVFRLQEIKSNFPLGSWKTIDVSDEKCSYRGCGSPCSHLILQMTTTAVQLDECPNVFSACENHLPEIESTFRGSLGSIHKAFKIENGQAVVHPRFWELRF